VTATVRRRHDPDALAAVQWPPDPLIEHVSAIASGSLVVVFGAQWVPVSGFVAAHWLDKEPDRVRFVDAERSPHLCEQYSIVTLPTVLRLLNGAEKARFIGLRTLTR